MEDNSVPVELAVCHQRLILTELCWVSELAAQGQRELQTPAKDKTGVRNSGAMSVLR